MSTINKQVGSQNNPVSLGGQRNYQEVIEFLDLHWSPKNVPAKDLNAIKKVDQILGFPSKATPIILVAGTNGKSLTIHFATKLFKEERMKVGNFITPHILTYNERLVVNNEAISNKIFTECANEVINAAQTVGVELDTLEILTLMALLHFKAQKVDVALLEMSNNTHFDPTNICYPKVLAITRVTNEEMAPNNDKTVALIDAMFEIVKQGTHVVSADQSKLNLQVMLESTQKRSGVWAMPIRKLAMLPYPFEQLHGRCAALAERICQIYIETYSDKEATIVANSLLAKQKGQRGRPTLEAKRQSEMNPKKTLDQFWKEEQAVLPAHFQILDKEKPTILLDNASNIDALKNLLLGIRLLHYQRPLKGLAFIFGCDKNEMNVDEFLRLLRYFSKKNSSLFTFCPIQENIPSIQEKSWDVEQITNDIKSLKIKAKSAKSFEEAFENAKKAIDERHGLIIISGSKSIITEYWNYKGIKKI